MAAPGQNCWPPAGSYMTATGQDLMAADKRHAGKLSNAHEAGDAQPMLDCSVSTIRHQADQNNATANGVHPLVIGTSAERSGRRSPLDIAITVGGRPSNWS